MSYTKAPWRKGFFIAVAFLLSFLSLATQVSAATRSIRQPAQSLQLASALQQARCVKTSIADTQLCGAPIPAARQLYMGEADTIVEPSAIGTDSNGNSYEDKYFWFLCGPGATTVALSYEQNISVLKHGLQKFTDPSPAPQRTTYWNDNAGRSYLMYIADQSQPPSFGGPGELGFGPYPNAGTVTNDIVDVLNWEASGHNRATWKGFFYQVQNVPNAAALNHNIVVDIANNVAPVAIVDSYELPDWSHAHSNAHVSHAIAIIGYDNNAGTYTYEQTCDSDCYTHHGHYTISQSALESAIQQDQVQNGVVGAIVW